MKNKNLKGGLFAGQPLTANETALSAMIGEYLAWRGAYQERVNSGLAQSLDGKHIIHLAREGTPDRLACYKGRFLGVEIKTPGAAPTPAQLARHGEIRRAGGLPLVVHSLEEMQSVLALIDSETETAAISLGPLKLLALLRQNCVRYDLSEKDKRDLMSALSRLFQELKNQPARP